MVSTTSAVLPRTVTCPSSAQAESTAPTSVETKVMDGERSASRNLAERTSLSRRAFPVQKLSASIVALTVERSSGLAT